MDNREFLEVLQNKKDEIIVPDGLKPERIEKLLDTVEDDNVVSADVIKASKKKRVKQYVSLVACAGIVACIILALVNIDAVKGMMEYSKYTKSAGIGFRTLRSYEALNEYILSMKEDEPIILSPSNDDYLYLGGAPSYSASDGKTSMMEIDFSDTNVRTEGVLEPDCVKTNGEYIFTIENAVLRIIKADGSDTDIIDRIYIENLMRDNELTKEMWAADIDEMIIKDNQLIVLGQWGEYGSEKTVVGVFDISDINNISLVDAFTIQGNYEEGRMYEDYLYVCTELRLYNSYTDEMNYPATNGEVCGCGHVYVVENDNYSSYCSITSYYIGDENKMVDHVSVLSGGNIDTYMTKENIYLMAAKYKYYTDETTTELIKFSYDEGNIVPKATKTIGGQLEDVFCIDEYDGYLRLVITDGNANNLYVFNKSLRIVGKITGLAEGERIYSARFDGEIGYFVTYKEIDPLFTVDLSNPRKPKIIGELKIPGYSDYMHMWGEDRMFGIGGENDQVKLSMFDISDPEDVLEEDKYVLRSVWSSDATRDHKALLIDSEKNIIGFDVQGLFGNNSNDNYTYGYSICSYDNGEFVEKLRMDFGKNYDMFISDIRGIYIDGYIYVVCVNGRIKVVDMNSFEIVYE